MKKLVNIVNPEANDLGDMLGIPKRRRQAIAKQLDEMSIEAESGKRRLVSLSLLFDELERFCENKEEVFWAYTNHIAWIYRTGRDVTPVDANQVKPRHFN